MGSKAGWRELDAALNQQPLPLTGEAPAIQAARPNTARWRPADRVDPD